MRTIPSTTSSTATPAILYFASCRGPQARTMTEPPMLCPISLISDCPQRFEHNHRVHMRTSRVGDSDGVGKIVLIKSTRSVESLSMDKSKSSEGEIDVVLPLAQFSFQCRLRNLRKMAYHALSHQQRALRTLHDSIYLFLLQDTRN